MKDKIKKLIIMVLFNALEIYCIIMLGTYLNVPIFVSVTLLAVFILSRFVFKMPKHYKKFYNCFIFSLSLYISLFLIFKAEFYLAVLLAVVSAYVLSGRADIDDMFLWRKDIGKYDDVVEFIDANKDEAIVKEFEDLLEKYDCMKYLVYKHRFLDKMSFSQIADKLDIPTQRITEELDAISLCIRVYCKIL